MFIDADYLMFHAVIIRAGVEHARNGGTGMPAGFLERFTESSDPGGGAATPRPQAQPRQRGDPGEGER
jgi:hypothetical protein